MGGAGGRGRAEPLKAGGTGGVGGATGGGRGFPGGVGSRDPAAGL